TLAAVPAAERALRRTQRVHTSSHHGCTSGKSVIYKDYSFIYFRSKIHLIQAFQDQFGFISCNTCSACDSYSCVLKDKPFFFCNLDQPPNHACHNLVNDSIDNLESVSLTDFHAYSTELAHIGAVFSYIATYEYYAYLLGSIRSYRYASVPLSILWD